MKKIDHEKKILLICIACVVCWVAVVALWMALDSRPPTWDSAYHVGQVIDFSRALFGPSGFVEWSDVINQHYPPLAYLILSPFACLSLSEGFLVSVCNLLFGMILAGSLFGICRLLQMPFAAIGAVLLSLSFPFMGILAKNFYLDFPLTAMVILALYFVFRCREEFSFKNGAILSVSLALGMLTKWTFVGYILAPLCFLFVEQMRAQSSRKEWISVFFKFLGMFLVVCLISGWWYWIEFERMKKYAEFVNFRTINFYPVPKILSWANLGYYLSERGGTNGSGIPIVFFLIGCFLLLKNKVRGTGLLISCFVGSCAFLTVLPNKDIRFTLPLIPVLSLIIFVGLESIKKKRLKKGLMGFMYLWCVLQFAFQHFLPLPPFLKAAEFRIVDIPLRAFCDIGMHGLSARPLNEDWYLKEIIEQVDKPVIVRADSGGHSLVLLLTDQMYHNPNTLSYEAKRLGRKIDFVSVASPLLSEKEKQDIASTAYDYIVYRPVTYEHYEYFTRFVGELHQALLVSGDIYKEIKTFLLPDGETLHIYRHNTETSSSSNQAL